MSDITEQILSLNPTTLEPDENGMKYVRKTLTSGAVALELWSDPNIEIPEPESAPDLAGELAKTRAELAIAKAELAQQAQTSADQTLLILDLYEKLLPPA